MHKHTSSRLPTCMPRGAKQLACKNQSLLFLGWAHLPRKLQTQQVPLDLYTLSPEMLTSNRKGYLSRTLTCCLEKASKPAGHWSPPCDVRFGKEPEQGYISPKLTLDLISQALMVAMPVHSASHHKTSCCRQYHRDHHHVVIIIITVIIRSTSHQTQCISTHMFVSVAAQQ